MNLSRNWLKEFVQIDADDHSFAEAMTMSGTKVEATHRPMAELHNIVIGQVVSMKKHENSDHMFVCQVNVGEKPLQIVTGAQNVTEKDLVPVALPDSVVAGGKEIKSGELRGEKSEGMLCSLGELGLDIRDFPYAIEDGIWIIQEEDAVIGADIRSITGLEDSIVEFEITPNRVDCYSILGLVREVAVTYGKTFQQPTPVVKATCQDNLMELLDVEVQEGDPSKDTICPRYTARMVRNVKIAPSPRWLRERLRSCNVRPINNIVDITNYVMLEYGQPMHAFDYRYIKGNKIIVRESFEGETVITLDGIVRTPPTGSLVIADESKALGLAGIMGGENSEIQEDTVDIVLESATFHSKAIRDCANALGMRTDASGLFEKGLNPLNTLPALDRACELIELLEAGEVVEGTIDCLQEVENDLFIPFVPQKINKLLGTDLTGEEMWNYLEPLGFVLAELTENEEENGTKGGKTDVALLENGHYYAKIPWWRTDMEWYIDHTESKRQLEENAKKGPDENGVIMLGCLPPFAHYSHLAEEVARFYGYDKIPTTFMRGETTQGGFLPEEMVERQVGSLCRAMGYSEIITYSFISPSDLDKIRLSDTDSRRNTMKILNPLGEDTSIMRTTLMPSMMDILTRNHNNRNTEVRLYELGRTYFQKEDGLAREKKVLTMGGYGETMDFFTLKGGVETLLKKLRIDSVSFHPQKENTFFHTGRCATIQVKGKEIGVLGQVHPLVAKNYGISGEFFYGELSMESVMELVGKVPQYQPLPKFPPVNRDIALLCDETTAVGDLSACIQEAGSEILREVTLFDIYQGKGIPEGKKSVAFNLILRSDAGSLTGEEADSEIATILKALEQKLSAVLR